MTSRWILVSISLLGFGVLRCGDSGNDSSPLDGALASGGQGAAFAGSGAGSDGLVAAGSSAGGESGLGAGGTAGEMSQGGDGASQTFECPPGLSKDAWTELPPVPHKRAEFGNAVYDGKIYLFGGVHDSLTGPTEVDVLDPATNEWYLETNLPEPRNHLTAGASLYEDEVWICGGRPNGESAGGTTRVDVYNFKTKSWRRGPDLPEPHWAAPSVVLDGKLHVLTGGIAVSTTSNHHFVLDLSNEAAGWTTAAPVPEPRVHIAGAVMDGKIWLIGGEMSHAHDGDTPTVQVYDPETDTWDTEVAQLPLKRSHHEWSTFAWDGELWSVGGVDSGAAQAGVYRLTPGGGEWEHVFDAPEKLASPGAKITQGVLYVYGGGINGHLQGDLSSVWARCLVDGSPDESLPASECAADDPVNFNEARDVTGAGSPTAVDVADLNGDGLPDLGLFGINSGLAWFEAKADLTQGNWTRHDLTAPPTSRPFVGAGKLGDIDGDGDVDAVVSMDNHSNAAKSAYIYWWENPANAQAATQPWAVHTIQANLEVHHINDMALADMDGDGKLDVVVRSLDVNQLHLYFQNGKDAWAHRALDASPFGAQGEGFAVGDINRDGTLDITICGHWLRAPNNPRSDAYDAFSIDAEYKTINANSKEAVGDINGDGRVDVVISPAEGYRGGNSHVLAWYQAPEDPTASSAWKRTVLASNMNGGHTVLLGDLDGDADLDVVSGIAWDMWGQTSSIRVFYNDGNGNFGDAQTVVQGKGLYTGVLGDISDDGDLDIIGQNTYEGGSKAYVYESRACD